MRSWRFRFLTLILLPFLWWGACGLLFKWSKLNYLLPAHHLSCLLLLAGPRFNNSLRDIEFGRWCFRRPYIRVFLGVKVKREDWQVYSRQNMHFLLTIFPPFHCWLGLILGKKLAHILRMALTIRSIALTPSIHLSTSVFLVWVLIMRQVCIKRFRSFRCCRTRYIIIKAVPRCKLYRDVRKLAMHLANVCLGYPNLNRFGRGEIGCLWLLLLFVYPINSVWVKLSRDISYECRILIDGCSTCGICFEVSWGLRDHLSNVVLSELLEVSIFIWFSCSLCKRMTLDYH